MIESLNRCGSTQTQKARNDYLAYAIGFAVMALIIFAAIVFFSAHGVHIEHYQAPATWALGASGPQATPVYP